MKKRTINLIVLIMGATLLLNMAATPLASLAYDPSGEWTYEVSMPDGSSLTGDMKVAKEDGEYSVTIYSDVYGTMNLNDVTMDENTIEATFEMEGDVIEFEMNFDGDYMEGYVYTPDGEIEMTAEKK